MQCSIMLLFICQTRITMFRFGLFCICLINLINSVSSKAVLIHPPSRRVLWRYGFDTPIDHNYMQGNCGGVDALKRNNGKCGLCGDALDRPQDHDDGGKYSTGVIGQAFTFGIKDIEVMIHLETFSRGYFEFRLCPCDDRFATEDCFNRYRLAIREGLQQGNPMRYYPNQSGLIGLTLALPLNMQCNRCVLQWHYVSGAIWGQGTGGSECMDCGHEEYYNCADIRIGSPYNYTFAPPKPSFPHVPKELKHISSNSPSVAVVNDGVRHPHSVPTPIPPPPSPARKTGDITSNHHHPNHEANGHGVAHGSFTSLIAEAKKPMPDPTLNKEEKGSTHHGRHEPSSEITAISSFDSGNNIPRPPPQRDVVVSISGGSNQTKDPGSNSLNINVKSTQVDPGASGASDVNLNVGASIKSNGVREKLPSETTVNISASSNDSKPEKSLQVVNNNIMVSLDASVKSTLNSNVTNINIDNSGSKAVPATDSITPVSSSVEGSFRPGEESAVAVLPRPKKIIDASDPDFTLNDDVNALLSFVGAIDTPMHPPPPPPVPSPLNGISASEVPSLSPSIKPPPPPPQSRPQPPPPPPPRRRPPPPRPPPPPSQPLRPPTLPAQPLRPPQPHVQPPIPPQPQPQLHSSGPMPNDPTISENSQTTHVQISPRGRITITNDILPSHKIQQMPAFNPNIPSRTRFFQPGERQFQPSTGPASGQSAWSTQNRGFGANSWDLPSQQFNGPQPLPHSHQQQWSQTHQPQVHWSQRSQSAQFPQRSQHRQLSPRQNQNDIFSQQVDMFSVFDAFREFIE